MTCDAFGQGLSEIFGPETQPDPSELNAYWAVISENQGQQVQPALVSYMAERRDHAGPWRQILVEPPWPIAMINGVRDPVSLILSR